MEEKSFSILVSTSERYEDIALAFIHFFRINYSDKIKIILVSNKFKKKFENYENIKLILKDDIWSNRIKYALSKIETKYILFFFEDFIIKNKVELSIIDSIFEFIKVNNIDYLKLNNTERKLINITDIINTNLMAGEIPPDDPYRLPLQISFWKKSLFNDLLNYESNPWEFERNIAKHRILNKNKIMSICDYQPIEYNKRGIVVKGKLIKKEIFFLKENNYILNTWMKTESYISYIYRENLIFKMMRNAKLYFFNKK